MVMQIWILSVKVGLKVYITTPTIKLKICNTKQMKLINFKIMFFYDISKLDNKIQENQSVL